MSDGLIFFYLYKGAPCFWFAFALAGFAELAIFYYLHGKVFEVMKGLEPGVANTDFQEISKDFSYSKHVFAAYCNTLFFTACWLLGEWVLSVFKEPSALFPGIAVFSSTVSVPTLSPPHIEIQRWATGWIILFMLPSLMLFCETLLNVANYPLTIAKFSTNAKLYKCTPRWSRSEPGRGNVVLFGLGWIAKYWALPLVWNYIRVTYYAWVRPNDESIFLFEGLQFDLDDNGRVVLADRFMIALLCLLMLLFNVFFYLHFLIYVFYGYNEKVLYYALFPVENINIHHIYLMLLYVAVCVIVAFASRRKKYVRDASVAKTYSLFLAAAIAHIFITALTAFPSFRIVGLPMNPRGLFSVSFLAVLISGAVFMLDSFHSQIERIFGIYSMKLNDALSLELIHRLKNDIMKISTAVGQACDDLQKITPRVREEDRIAMQKLLKIISVAQDRTEGAYDYTNRVTSLLRSDQPQDIENLHNLIQMIIKNRMDIGPEKVVIDFSLSAKRASARIITSKFTNALDVILDNSMEQSNKVGTDLRMLIRGVQLEGHIIISIYDNCKGAPLEILAAMGKRMITTKSLEIQSRGGTGTGLYAAHRYFQMMNGTLEFENASWGEANGWRNAGPEQFFFGLKVIITLPLAGR